MIISPKQLSEDALQGVLEEFIGREGTDYGEQELSLAEKVERLRPQVMRGEVVIVFDEFLETLTLAPRKDMAHLLPNSPGGSADDEWPADDK